MLQGAMMGQVGQTAAERQVSEVQSGLEQLANNIERLGAGINSLDARLSPVSSSAPTSPPKNEQIHATPGSPIGQVLLELRLRTQGLERIVDSMHERLRL